MKLWLLYKKNLHIYSTFIQDKLTLIENRLYFTLGTKIGDNSYTGLEYSPSGHLAWTPARNQIVWAAVSRAIRMPSRINRVESINGKVRIESSAGKGCNVQVPPPY